MNQIRHRASGDFSGSSGYAGKSRALDSRIYRVGGENGMQKLFKIIRAADQVWRSDPAANGGKKSEHDQRAGHAPGRFVDVNFMLVVARLAEEGQENQAEHVERSQSRADKSEQPEPDIAGARGFENFVLAEESGETGDAGNGQRGDKHAPKSDGNF